MLSSGGDTLDTSTWNAEHRRKQIEQKRRGDAAACATPLCVRACEDDTKEGGGARHLFSRTAHPVYGNFRDEKYIFSQRHVSREGMSTLRSAKQRKVITLAKTGRQIWTACYFLCERLSYFERDSLTELDLPKNATVEQALVWICGAGLKKEFKLFLYFCMYL